MSYWFTDPALKGLLPLALSSSIQGLQTVFNTPQIIMGSNVFPEGPVIGPSTVDFLTARSLSKRTFVVTDEFAERFAKRVVQCLSNAGFECQIWNGALPEVPMNNVKECARVMSEFEPGLIVAVGGGSVIDGAKAAWILYERPDITDLFTLSPLEPIGLRKKAVLAAVPTTSGTGSEVTAVSVLHDVEAHRKVPIVGGELLPDFAILCPEFTMTMPPKLTAGTGLDALTHAIDSVTTPSGNELTDALGLAAIEMVFKYLPRAYVNGQDREARHRMIMAATTAGISFGNAGACLPHSFGHSLGSLFNIHHGLAVGIFIPYVLQFYAQVSDKYLAIARVLRMEGKTKEESLFNLVSKVRALFKELDVPLSLKDLDIPADKFEEKMEKLVLYAYEDIDTFFTPRPITMAQAEQIFRYAYEGKDIDF